MNLLQVDLNLLVALDAILREKHLTRAGEQLGLSQPTMSHTLARLRRLFDDDLLTRLGREYYLTPLATELVEPIRDILKQIEMTVERRLVFNPGEDERVFNISASDYATYLVLQPALQRIGEEAPRVSVQVHPLERGARARVETGEIDLAIWPTAIGPDLPHQGLFTDRWVGVAWSQHPDVHETLSLEQYLMLPHASYGTGTSTSDSTSIADRAVMASEHHSGHVVVTVESFFLIPFLLTGTRLVSLVHERLAQRLLHMADIKVVDLLFDTPSISEAMYWHPRLTSDPAHRWLRDVLTDSSRTISAQNGLAFHATHQ
jgi:LysR family transcriptional regulator, nod-box dependent transcriptional activator